MYMTQSLDSMLRGLVHEMQLSAFAALSVYLEKSLFRDQLHEQDSQRGIHINNVEMIKVQK